MPDGCQLEVLLLGSVIFFFKWSGDHRDLHSFPTRRSSDLTRRGVSGVPASRGWLACQRSTASTWSDRKSTRLNSSHRTISYAVFCLKKKKLNSAIVCSPDSFARYYASLTISCLPLVLTSVV